MSLRSSYRIITPFYDAFIKRYFDRIRAESIKSLPESGGQYILIDGIGTGLDLPFLPVSHRYVGIDLTETMLERARHRSQNLQLNLVQGDSMSLPFRDNTFDHGILHLILAVVPDSVACLREAARALKPGGTLLVMDKFLRPGQSAPIRRLLSPIMGKLATKLDVVFEEVLEEVSGLTVEQDHTVAAGGWFRAITLRKN
jgi:phosphatidylethanolamine/phosphatidyl-N-methylethanolamine N-methyltransferase